MSTWLVSTAQGIINPIANTLASRQDKFILELRRVPAQKDLLLRLRE